MLQIIACDNVLNTQASMEPQLIDTAYTGLDMILCVLFVCVMYALFGCVHLCEACEAPPYMSVTGTQGGQCEGKELRCYTWEMGTGPSLKVIGTMSVGHDHIDMAEVKARGIKVGFTPDVLTDSTAELVVALLLMTSRRLVEARDQIYNGGWAGCAWSPLWMCGQGLAGSTAGIVGLGRIGQGVASRLKPFNVSKILYSGRTEKPEAGALGAEHVPFDELLARSDFVIVTCALNDDTKGLFNEAAFKKMKKNAVLVNASRGGTVDQPALVAALKSCQIQAAGLDVMTPEPLPSTHELANMTNCTLTPHVGSATVKSRTDMATLTSRNILAALDGAEMPARLC